LYHEIVLLAEYGFPPGVWSTLKGSRRSGWGDISDDQVTFLAGDYVTFITGDDTF